MPARSCRPHDGAQLDGEHLGLHVDEPDGTHAEEWIRLRLERQVRQGLVATDVEEPDHHRPAPECGEDARVGPPLHLLIRCRRAAEEHELGTQQTDRLGSAGEGPGSLVGPADVRGERHSTAVGGRERLGGELAVALGIVAPRGCRHIRARSLHRRGLDDELTGVAVDEDGGAIRHDVEQPGQPHHGGDAE